MLNLSQFVRINPSNLSYVWTRFMLFQKIFLRRLSALLYMMMIKDLIFFQVYFILKSQKEKKCYIHNIEWFLNIYLEMLVRWGETADSTRKKIRSCLAKKNISARSTHCKSVQLNKFHSMKYKSIFKYSPYYYLI